jgi:hypothetical protein
VEDVFPRLLGLPLDLARWEGLVGHWHRLKPLPSPHDLTMFRLENLRSASWDGKDACDLYLKTDALYHHVPMAYLRHAGVEKSRCEGDDFQSIPERRLEQSDDGGLSVSVRRCVVIEEVDDQVEAQEQIDCEILKTDFG